MYKIIFKVQTLKGHTIVYYRTPFREMKTLDIILQLMVNTCKSSEVVNTDYLKTIKFLSGQYIYLQCFVVMDLNKFCIFAH